MSQCVVTDPSRVHSRYNRTVTDLPWASIPVQLRLQVRKFFCHNTQCERSIFTERLPTVVSPWARRSLRLTALQRQLGLDFGGEAGARASNRLGLLASGDTVLRMVRRGMAPARPTPRVLGVDDWAKCRGQTYGTILVDVESHEAVDLLPDRTADTFGSVAADASRNRNYQPRSVRRLCRWRQERCARCCSSR